MLTKSLVLCCLLGACAPAIDDGATFSTESVESSRDVAVVEIPFDRVTDEEMRRLFHDRASFEAQLGSAPEGVDWSTQSLFYYSAGAGSRGARVFVDGARLSRSGKTLTFQTRRESDEAGCDAPTRAAVLVAIARPDQQPEYVRSEHEETTRACPADRECASDAECAAPLRCIGKARDGAAPYGVCRDTSIPEGFGVDCRSPTDCAAGLLCAGLSRRAEGVCVSGWMAGTFRDDSPRLPAIPDADPAGAQADLVIYGQASVPVDVWLHLDLEHARASDLVITLEDPTGELAVIWDRRAGAIPSRIAVTEGISGDAAVNGRWTLHVADEVAGESGTLHGWAVEVTSRWD